MAKKRSRKLNKKKPSKFFLKKPFLITSALIIIGFLLLSIPLAIKIHNETILSFKGTYTNSATYAHKVIPVKITIPKIDVSLPVYKTQIVNGTWQIAENGASYLENSSGIGEKHSAIIYNHNTIGKFNNLSKLKVNDTIILEGSDKKLHVYKVKSTTIVDQTDVKILTEDPSQNIILYTCYGFADLKRFVVKAVPTN